jgi:hypothetical protein
MGAGPYANSALIEHAYSHDPGVKAKGKDGVLLPTPVGRVPLNHQFAIDEADTTGNGEAGV